MTAIPRDDLERVWTPRQAMLWKEHQETLDWVIRKWRAFTPSSVRITHDGERVLFIHEAPVGSHVRTFIASVDPLAYCSAQESSVVGEMVQTLFKEVRTVQEIVRGPAPHPTGNIT